MNHRTASWGEEKLGREGEEAIWSFVGLSRTSNYVRNTHRQAATRAIRIDGGLGFASGTGFDLLALEPVGRALANAFLDQRVGKGGGSLRNWLKGWLNSTHVPGWSESLLTALSPEYPTPSECQIVKSRVLDTSTDSSAKRRQLAQSYRSSS